MSMLRIVAIALLLAIGSGLPASGQQPHWLVGTWDGEVRGLGNNPTGSMRSFIIASVPADGSSAQGTWKTESTTATVAIAINGDVITFKPGGVGNDYRLTRQGNKLEGSWTANNGRSGGVTLTKK
jgi:hypothetical protein